METSEYVIITSLFIFISIIIYITSVLGYSSQTLPQGQDMDSFEDFRTGIKEFSKGAFATNPVFGIFYIIFLTSPISIFTGLVILNYGRGR